MKTQRITFITLIILFLLSLNMEAREEPCEVISYRQIVDEHEHYIDAIEEIERKYDFYQFQSTHNMKNVYKLKMKELSKELEKHLNKLTKIQKKLDQMQINICDSLLGSPTGYCMKNGELEKMTQSEKESAKKKESDNSSSYHHSSHYTDPNNAHHSRAEIKRNSHKIDRLTMQDIKAITRLSSTSIKTRYTKNKNFQTSNNKQNSRVHGKTR